MEQQLLEKQLEKVDGRGVTQHLGQDHPVVVARQRWLQARRALAEAQKPATGEKPEQGGAYAS